MIKDALQPQDIWTDRMQELQFLQSQIDSQLPVTLDLSREIAEQASGYISGPKNRLPDLVGEYNLLMNNTDGTLLEREWSLTPIVLPRAYARYVEIQTEVYSAVARAMLDRLLGDDADEKLERAICGSLPRQDFPSFWRSIDQEWQTYRTTPDTFSFSGRNDTLDGKILEPNATAVGNMPEVTTAEMVSQQLLQAMGFSIPRQQNSPLEVWAQTLITAGRKFSATPSVGLMCSKEEYENGGKKPRFTTLVRYLQKKGIKANFIFTDDPKISDTDGFLFPDGTRPTVFFKDVDVPRDLPPLWTPDFERAVLQATAEGRIVSPLLGDLLNTKAWFMAYSDPQYLKQIGANDSLIALARAVFPWSRVVRAGKTTDSNGQPIGDLATYIKENASRLYLKPTYTAGGKGTEDAGKLTDEQIRAIIAEGQSTPGKWLVQRKLPYFFVPTVRATGEYGNRAFSIDVSYGTSGTSGLIGSNLASRANSFKEGESIVTNTGRGGMYVPVYLAE